MAGAPKANSDHRGPVASHTFHRCPLYMIAWPLHTPGRFKVSFQLGGGLIVETRSFPTACLHSFSPPKLILPAGGAWVSASIATPLIHSCEASLTEEFLTKHYFIGPISSINVPSGS